MRFQVDAKSGVGVDFFTGAHSVPVRCSGSGVGETGSATGTPADVVARQRWRPCSPSRPFGRGGMPAHAPLAQLRNTKLGQERTMITAFSFAPNRVDL